MASSFIEFNASVALLFTNSNLSSLNLSSSTSGLKIIYLPNVEFSSYDSISMKEKLETIFEKNYMKELNYGMTIFGPHRDDFIFQFDGNDLKYYGSQGEQKLAILSFKLSEIDIFKNLAEQIEV